MPTSPQDPYLTPGFTVQQAYTPGTGTFFQPDGSVDLADLSPNALAGLNGTYAGIASGRPGNRAVFLGTSITAGADDIVNNARGEAWPVYAAIMSGQRIRYVQNAGKSGDTAAGMLARFDTDVTPYAPNVVFIEPTRNDLSTDLATWQGQVRSLVAKTIAIGAVPIICTCVPTTSTTIGTDKAEITKRNAWLREYAASIRAHVFNMYGPVVDPANGDYLSGYTSDNVHPLPIGISALAAQAVADIAPILPVYQPMLVQDAGDPSSAVYNGVFAGYSGTTLPTGWADNAGIPSGSVLSYATDAKVKGQMVTLTATATAGVRQLQFAGNIGTAALNADAAAGATTISVTINPSTRATLFIGSGATAEIAKVASVSGSGTTFTATLVRPLRYAHAAATDSVVINGVVGDQIMFTGVTTSDGGVTNTAEVVFASASKGVKAMSSLSQAITRGVFLSEAVIPASTTALQVRLTAGPGTGVCAWGQVGLYNKTRLGVLG